jgi:alanyl-tRNA synthetase
MSMTANPTKRLFFEDVAGLDFDARVVERREFEGHPAVVLDQTGFYAESGGQPWDLGTIDGIPVLKVVEDGTVIVHVLDRPLAGEAVHGSIDGARRFDHMQQHTGQHVLSQAFVEILNGETKSFHMGAAVATLEIGIAAASDEALERVERRANAVIFQDRPVRTYFVEPDRIRDVPLRRPPKVEGTVRVVEIEGFDYSACGGTHVRRTGEIGMIKITGTEKIRGRLRFEFLCGGRALADYQAKNRIVRDLAGALNAPGRDVPAAVSKLAAELKTARKALRAADERAAGYEARDLAAGARGPIISGVFPEKTPEAVRALALNLIRRGEFVVLLACRSEAHSHIVLARSESLSLDLRTLVPLLGPLVQGKGGGSPGVVEIACARGADLDAALAKAEESVRN